MRDYIGEEFDGVISGAAAFGFWVETVEHKCEGMVGIASLAEYDDFRFVDTDYSLVGMRSNRKFRIGDKVRIKVIAANLEKRHLDYEWVLTTTIEEGEEVPTFDAQKQVQKPKEIQKPKQKAKAKNKKKKSEE
jgi:ribonuclease R